MPNFSPRPWRARWIKPALKVLALGLGANSSSFAMDSLPTHQSMEQLDLGQYRIGESPRYCEAVRRSVYVPMRDGVRLAVDFYLPANQGRVVRGRFPVLFEYTRYGRARPGADGGTVRWRDAPADARGRLKIPTSANGPLLMLAHGYAVVVADMRGAGASFGSTMAEGDAREGRDGFDIIEWIARQRWSDGTVGMLGASYLAEIQPRVAAERPRALKALAMDVPFFDEVNGGYAMGGVLRAGWLGVWNSRVAIGDNRSTAPRKRIENIAPVDADPDQTELQKAIEEHRRSEEAADGLFSRMWELETAGVLRDRYPFVDTYQATGQNNLHTLVGRVNASGIPALLFGGWYDLYTNDSLYWFENLEVPHKLIMGPYGHGSRGPHPNDSRDADRKRIVARETLRWFDHWLRRIDNGAEHRPPVHYGLQRSREETEWYTAPTWPPAEAHYREWHLSAHSAESVQSQNDGSLTSAPDERSSNQPWTIDYSTSLGTSGTRWQMFKVMEIDMVPNEMKSMTYTSTPLERDLRVVGIPIVKVMFSSENAKDADIYAYLTAVDAEGVSRLVSEGILRASHRTLGKAPYRNFDLPFPTSDSKDVSNTPPLSATPVPLEFSLYAVGRVFRAGERVRLTISGADRGNTVTPELSPPPKLGIHVGGGNRSVLRLPVLNVAHEAR